MNKSESIGKLIEALSKAQAQLKPVKKDSLNPFFKSKYSNLVDIWQMCRKPLADNGLAICQTVDIDEGNYVLLTILGHTSGEWISSKMPLIMTKKDAQGLGSAITYSKRYALSAMVGITSSDDVTEDDAEGACDNTKSAPTVKVRKYSDLKHLSVLLYENIEQLKNPEHIEKYLKYCSEKTPRNLSELVNSWINSPEPFLEHFNSWVKKNIPASTKKVEQKAEAV